MEWFVDIPKSRAAANSSHTGHVKAISFLVQILLLTIRSMHSRERCCNRCSCPTATRTTVESAPSHRHPRRLQVQTEDKSRLQRTALLQERESVVWVDLRRWNVIVDVSCCVTYGGCCWHYLLLCYCWCNIVSDVCCCNSIVDIGDGCDCCSNGDNPKWRTIPAWIGHLINVLHTTSIFYIQQQCFTCSNNVLHTTTMFYMQHLIIYVTLNHAGLNRLSIRNHVANKPDKQ